MSSFTSVVIDKILEQPNIRSEDSTQDNPQTLEYPWESEKEINEGSEEEENDEKNDDEDENWTPLEKAEHKNQTPFGEITATLVAKLIKERPQGLKSQRYQLSDEDYKMLGKLFFNWKSKDSYFSKLFRDSGLPLNLDSAISIFKAVEKHFKA